MELDDLLKRAVAIRDLYEELETKIHGRAWTKEEIALGFVGDVGDLAKLIMAAEGIRDIPDAQTKLAHELADCLWSILVLTHLYGIDIGQAFLQTMNELEAQIKAKL